jgi:hypothetical protein
MDIRNVLEFDSRSLTTFLFDVWMIDKKWMMEGLVHIYYNPIRFNQ